MNDTDYVRLCERRKVSALTIAKRLQRSEASVVPKFKRIWHAAFRRAKIRYFRIYDLRSTFATRLSAGGVADQRVTQIPRQGSRESV